MLKLSYPAINNEPVTQVHVNYCTENGHATYSVNGDVQAICPRCGEIWRDAKPFTCSDPILHRKAAGCNHHH